MDLIFCLGERVVLRVIASPNEGGPLSALLVDRPHDQHLAASLGDFYQPLAYPSLANRTLSADDIEAFVDADIYQALDAA